jgi:hypothetical protein
MRFGDELIVEVGKHCEASDGGTAAKDSNSTSRDLTFIPLAL